jgi:uncharacterized membrane protein
MDRLSRFAYLHARLLLSLLAGLAVAAWLHELALSTQLLLSWDVCVGCYLIASCLVFVTASVDQIRRRAALQDEGGLLMLLLSCGAALASLVAIVFELVPDGKGQVGLHVALGMSTVALSWAFIAVIFTFHYAHEYYGERGDSKLGGLQFPGKEDPDYFDFLYFALVLAMTSQVSDVSISGRTIRRVASAHGVLSFFFNIAILALTMSVVSGLIAK